MNEAEYLRAEVLLQALPYIRRFSGKAVVIKYGGAAMDKADLRDQFAQDVTLLQYVGIHPVIVHGGGPMINSLLEKLGVKSEFIAGHRVTDEASMEVVEMVLAGQVNKSLVSLINFAGGRAVGLSGRDGRLARGQPHFLQRTTEAGTVETISLGRVGTVSAEDVDVSILESLRRDGFIPVIAPIAYDDSGKALNINADTMAGAIASALKAEKLILLTDTPGVLHEGRTLTNLTPAKVRELIVEGIISGGMLPKVECCLTALNYGVKRTHIIDGRIPHALLLEIFTDRGVGTLLCQEEELVKTQ
ncbi:MAG: acetylglutamate kinase [Leptospiraceae bacterium]|nr:acetylglutamate kinase [Leptospiraceae bacterium]MDW8307183.1 acetylglutamate kinase [Leptospiraceae bacterium]